MLKKITPYLIAASVGILIGLILTCIFHPVVVSGNSMYPTYTDKEILRGTSISSSDDIHRGDVIVFRRGLYPYIKRVVALPGDEIEVNENELYINGNKLNDEFPQMENAGDYIKDKIILADNEYFCIGDNRNNSFDCRVFGPITYDQISYKVADVLLDLNELY